MNTSENEKEWLKRICGGQPSVEHKAAPVKEAESKPVSKKVDHGRGFKDIAGMNELKELVTEGFINVLKNPKCAEVYGLKPPSMLFYGPAGCGKTFFAEKMAEEVGIYNPQIQISAESGTKRSNFRQKDKTKRSKKGCTQHL